MVKMANFMVYILPQFLKISNNKNHLIVYSEWIV